MDLSLCMIVKNEEASLPQCLGSVRDVVNEMVVLDTGSSDQTRQIAKDWGAKVYTFEWCDDFAVARNEALKYVHGEWVLVLDADERLTPAIIPTLKQAIAHERLLLINLMRREVGAVQSPYSLVSRLFRNRPDIRFSRPYHAMVDDSIAEILQREPHWQITALPQEAILHFGYQPDAITANHKWQKAQATMERYLAQCPTDPYVCSKLGALYVESGEIQKGIALLKRGLAAISIDANVLYELHYHLGIAYRHLQDVSKAKQHYEAATQLKILPLLKLGAYNNLGNLLKEGGNLNGAKIAYEIVLQIDPSFAAGHYNLGMTLKALGNLTGAVASYRQAICLNPDYAEAYQNLGVVLLKLGNIAAGLEAFNQAIQLHESRNPSEATRLRQGLQEMGFLPK